MKNYILIVITSIVMLSCGNYHTEKDSQIEVKDSVWWEYANFYPENVEEVSHIRLHGKTEHIFIYDDPDAGFYKQPVFMDEETYKVFYNMMDLYYNDSECNYVWEDNFPVIYNDSGVCRLLLHDN